MIFRLLATLKLLRATPSVSLHEPFKWRPFKSFKLCSILSRSLVKWPNSIRPNTGPGSELEPATTMICICRLGCECVCERVSVSVHLFVCLSARPSVRPFVCVQLDDDERCQNCHCLPRLAASLGADAMMNIRAAAAAGPMSMCARHHSCGTAPTRPTRAPRTRAADLCAPLVSSHGQSDGACLFMQDKELAQSR